MILRVTEKQKKTKTSGVLRKDKNGPQLGREVEARIGGPVVPVQTSPKTTFPPRPPETDPVSALERDLFLSPDRYKSNSSLRRRVDKPPPPPVGVSDFPRQRRY